MCSYNRLNDTYACSNSKTINGILKTELGFQGSVVSDWGATHAGVATALAGLDVNMPGPILAGDSTQDSFWGYNLTEMIQNGSVPLSRLDDMVIRALMPYYFLNQDSASYPTIDIDTAQINGGMTGAFLPSYQHPFNLGNLSDAYRDVRANNSQLIHEIGAASAVLLKNINQTLPLRNPTRIAVFGNDAADLTGGPYDPANVIGIQATGGGSGAGRFTNLITPLNAIKQRAPNALVQYISDNTIVTGSNPSGGQLSTIFPEPDVCLVFLKTYATEGLDRPSLLCDWDSSDVVSSVTSSGFCGNTVVVTHSAGPNTMPWADNANVNAIIAAHYPGEQAGNAIVDVLFGDVNPSARLPYTIARQSSDYNAPIVNFTDSDDPNIWQSNFTEGLLIDYRHFDSSNIDPLYEFGFGLSYTNFSLSNVIVAPTSAAAGISAYSPALGSAIPPPGGNPALYDVLATVTFTVQNTGSVAGATVPQLYLGFPPSNIPTAPKVLRGFERTTLLDPGQSTTLTFQLRRKDLSSWDIGAQDWKLPGGAFQVMLGWSSRNLPETHSLSLR
jgi:beta-glucosidase